MIEQTQRVEYRAICDRCKAAGPACNSESAAMEAVTASLASSQTGISLTSRWAKIGGELLCGACVRGLLR